MHFDRTVNLQRPILAANSTISASEFELEMGQVRESAKTSEKREKIMKTIDKGVEMLVTVEKRRENMKTSLTARENET